VRLYGDARDHKNHKNHKNHSSDKKPQPAGRSSQSEISSRKPAAKDFSRNYSAGTQRLKISRGIVQPELSG
jgi:hypothetical protein